LKGRVETYRASAKKNGTIRKNERERRSKREKGGKTKEPIAKPLGVGGYPRESGEKAYVLLLKGQRGGALTEGCLKQKPRHGASKPQSAEPS